MERSRTSHFWQTSEVELRLRTSETAAMMLERMTSGRSLMVVVQVSCAAIDRLFSMGEFQSCNSEDFWVVVIGKVFGKLGFMN